MRNKIFKSATFVVLLCVLALTGGCLKPEDVVEGQDEIHINPEYVPIDWENTEVVSSDDSTGTYDIQFADSVPGIHPGSIIAIDRDTVVLYRIVTSASVSGNTVSVTTAEAYLTDIFYDTEFTLSTSRGTKAKGGGAVFYPVEACMIDDHGMHQPLRIDMHGKRDTRFTQNLWQFEYNNDGHVIAAGNNFAIYMEKMNLDLGLDMEMSMNFGGRNKVEAVGEAYERYRSRALKVSAALVGTFNTEQKIRCDIEGSCSYAPAYDIWKHNLFRPLCITFVVSGVPIRLVLRSDLFRQVEVSASGEISAYTGFSDHAVGRMGFEWSQAGGITPAGSFSNTFEFIPPTVEGKGQVQAKVWAFPRVSVMLWDAVGPSFDFMPYMADTLRGGFREQMLGQTNDYCAWSLDCHAGLDLRCGLSMRFFGYEVENYSTPRWNCIDRRLYHSPQKIVHASGRPEQGQAATVVFNVFDRNHLSGSDVPTPLPQIVKFEAEGQLSSGYGIARNGSVSVSWTPAANDVLYAKLYGQDGSVLAWDTVQAEACECNLTSGDWVDLGLPSGLLWATRNVGASSPTDYGNYYAWGEISPKSEYSLGTYRYFNSSTHEFTKYTGSDGLTTLQPEDDAATAHYGGRTPTTEEWDELYQHTTSRWVTFNGVYGRCFTGVNGISLFLPAAGYRFSELRGAGEYGYYWSSSLYEGNPVHAWHLLFFEGGRYMEEGGRSMNCCYYRFSGFPVRAVQ